MPGRREPDFEGRSARSEGKEWIEHFHSLASGARTLVLLFEGCWNERSLQACEQAR